MDKEITKTISTEELPVFWSDDDLKNEKKQPSSIEDILEEYDEKMNEEEEYVEKNFSKSVIKEELKSTHLDRFLCRVSLTKKASLEI